MLVAGIGRLDPAHQGGIEIFPVRHAAAIDFGQRAGVDQAGECRFVAWHDDIVAGMTGEQLAFQRLQAVEDVVAHFDPGLGGELFQRGGVDVIGPVVNVEDLVFGPGRKPASSSKTSKQQTLHRLEPGGMNAACVPPSTGMVVPVT